MMYHLGASNEREFEDFSALVTGSKPQPFEAVNRSLGKAAAPGKSKKTHTDNQWQFFAR